MIKEKVQKIKEHVKKHKEIYIFGVTLAGITTVIMRGTALQYISRGTPVTANGGIPVVGKNIVIGSISYISANRQGSPSWVVRCLETGKIFTSQRSAATLMDLPENELSRHLNGILDHVRGYHFERICMAA